MPKINNFKSFNEARLRDNSALDPDYIDRIKSEEEAEAHRKIRSGEVTHPSQIIPMVQDLMQMQGGELRMTMMGPMPVWNDRDKKEQIEQLARDIIDDQYGRLIEALNITMDIKLVDMDELKSMKDSDEMTEEPDPEIEETEDEDFKLDVDKRKIANVITQGSAKNTHRLIHLHKDKIDEIDDRLFNLMDNLIKAQETAEWTMPEQEGAGKMIKQFMNGYTSTKFEDGDEEEVEEKVSELDVDKLINGDEGEMSELEENFEDYTGKIKVTARAIDLTVLLHESVKGIYEVLSSPSLPSEYELGSEEKATNIMLNTDTLEDEFEDLRYGPRIRQDLLSFVNSNDKVNKIDDGFEYVWGAMVSLKSGNFLALIKDILINKTGRAESWLDKTLDDLVSDFEEYKRQEMEYNLGKENDYEEESDVVTEDPEKVQNDPVEEKRTRLRFYT